MKIWKCSKDSITAQVYKDMTHLVSQREGHRHIKETWDLKQAACCTATGAKRPGQPKSPAEAWAPQQDKSINSHDQADQEPEANKMTFKNQAAKANWTRTYGSTIRSTRSSDEFPNSMRAISNRMLMRRNQVKDHRKALDSIKRLKLKILARWRIMLLEKKMC